MKLYFTPYPMNSARKQLSWMWSIVAILCFSVNTMFAESDISVACQLSCEDLVHFSLDENCEGEVTVGLMTTDTTDCGVPNPLFVKIVDEDGDTLNTNVITSEYVGQTLTVIVCDPDSRNSCWGELLVEDKLINDLFCQNDTFDCDVIPTPANTFFPFDPAWAANATPVPGADPDLGPWNVSNFDSCGNAVLTLNQRSVSSNCGTYNQTIFRTWKITDESGNMASCMDTIYLRNLVATSVTWPNDTIVDCEDRRDDLNNDNCGPVLGWNVIQTGPFAGHPSPDDMLYPCGDVKWEGTGNPFVGACTGIQMTFSDLRINHCSTGSSDGCFKILRSWTVLDWCTGAVYDTTQLIKIVDDEGPQIADIDDLTISTDVWRCEADWYATEPWLMDNCSSEPLDYVVTSTVGTVEQLPDGRFRILGLVPGEYDITYSAFDCCGNQTDSTITLTVLDDVPPVPVCDARTVVSISTTNNIDDSNRGTTKVFAPTFDDGSHDNCGNEVYFKVIRMDELDANGNSFINESVADGDWVASSCNGANGDDDPRISRPGDQAYFDDYVKFCCDDVDPNNPVMVVFRVYDVDPEPYTIGKVAPGSVPAGENPDDYNGVTPESQAQGGGLYGRYSDCMVEVEVQDKLPPYVVAPPNITVTCDYWFPFDKENPQDYTDELDGIFGKVVPNTADPDDLDSIVITDRVCVAHPRFNEFAPAIPSLDPCYDDTYDIFWGFDGYAIDNCNIDTIEQTIIPDLHCNMGVITRRWRAIDQGGRAGNIATQTITIIDCKEYYVPLVCWRFTPGDIGSCDLTNPNPITYQTKLIEWPCDVDVNTCQANTNALSPDNLPSSVNDNDRRPRWFNDACNLLGETHVDRRFTFIDGACEKIFRDWTVIDWCAYEERQRTGNTSIIYEWNYTQVIKLLNTEGPVFQDQIPLSLCAYGNIGDPSADDQCVGGVQIEHSFEDDCTADSLLRIDYKIDLNNDGVYDRYGYSSNRPNPFPGLGAKPFDLDTIISDSILPVGNHTILWTAQDGCGNLGSYAQSLTIEDCKPPTPYCRTGISTISMPPQAGGFVDVWASDFNIGSYDNCTDSTELIYSFSNTDPTVNSMRFFCDTLSGDTFDLQVFVWDLGLDGLPRNYAGCDVTVRLSDCDNQTTYMVMGGIVNEVGQTVKDVDVLISGYMNSTQTTSNNGQFAFSLPRGENYTVKPSKDINHRNGVSTYDLVQISKHITGQQRLNSPYKMIAADVNNTGDVTTFDIIELRKLILYINTEFPDNTSWRFVPSDYIFNNQNDPFAQSFPEVYTINALNADMNASFSAIKVGDVNGSASVNNLTGGAQTRTSGETLTFQVADQQLSAGQVYEVAVSAEDLSQVTGYQFTMNYDASKVQVTDVIAGNLKGLSEANFGLIEDKAAITTSWNGQADLTEGTTVFTLRLTATSNTTLSEALSISSDLTNAEAYTADAELMNVELNFKGNNAASGFALYQNTPNPFRNNTVISFNLPESQQAQLSIYDVTGKVLKVYNGNFVKGYNEVSLNGAELNSTGILYYTLRTENHTATRKMILID